jgi:hypothetical protein
VTLGAAFRPRRQHASDLDANPGGFLGCLRAGGPAGEAVRRQPNHPPAAFVTNVAQPTAPAAACITAPASWQLEACQQSPPHDFAAQRIQLARSAATVQRVLTRRPNIFLATWMEFESSDDTVTSRLSYSGRIDAQRRKARCGEASGKRKSPPLITSRLRPSNTASSARSQTRGTASEPTRRNV